ncbi:putative monooxygenase p33MONOX isoform X2 [Paroedura picta]|uniref:putative monooxygenase p33MONOX isoform X2 n=1 Tax=Paroedura picta TaxID=143630 RepID=UPI0040579626
MASRRTDVPAIEQGSEGLLGKMSQPIGMYRRAFSYDDALEDTTPMTPPPSNMCSNILWKQPVIPDRKYEALSKVEEGETNMHPSTISPSTTTETVNKVPVVKAKATHIIINSLMTKQTQESIQRFERQAGLRDAGYTPHKGLTAEETKYHRVAESLHVRTWFSQGASTSISGPDLISMDSSGGDSDKASSEKWSLFGPRALQKSSADSGGFTIQAYRGAQKPTPIELMRTQATRIAEDPATFKPPKMDIPIIEEKRRSPQSHNIRPRDMNVLTPTGF